MASKLIGLMNKGPTFSFDFLNLSSGVLLCCVFVFIFVSRRCKFHTRQHVTTSLQLKQTGMGKNTKTL